jgi:hypothetical protein
MAVNNSEVLSRTKQSILPKKPLKRLRIALEELFDQITRYEWEKPRKSGNSNDKYLSVRATWEVQIREAFLRF